MISFDRAAHIRQMDRAELERYAILMDAQQMDRIDADNGLHPDFPSRKFLTGLLWFSTRCHGGEISLPHPRDFEPSQMALTISEDHKSLGYIVKALRK